MVALPPDRDHSHADPQGGKRGDLCQTAPVDRHFFQPQNQEQRRRQSTGCRFGRERQRVTDQGQSVNEPPTPRVFIEELDPSHQGKKEEKSHQHIFAFGNPRDGFDLNRMQREDRCRQPRARHAQSRQHAPHQDRIGGMEQEVDQMIACGI